MKQGATIWLCGLAGSGKSTLAKALIELLTAKFDNVIYLDGDDIRELFGLCSYDKQGRIEIGLQYYKMAKFLSKQGQIVVVSTISLFKEIYNVNRASLKNYFEVFIECDFEELKRRDQKNLYTKALQSEIKNVVGVDIQFDYPKPHLIIDNSKMDKLEEKTKYIFDEFMKFYKP